MQAYLVWTAAAVQLGELCEIFWPTFLRGNIIYVKPYELWSVFQRNTSKKVNDMPITMTRLILKNAAKLTPIYGAINWQNLFWNIITPLPCDVTWRPFPTLARIVLNGNNSPMFSSNTGIRLARNEDMGWNEVWQRIYLFSYQPIPCHNLFPPGYTQDNPGAVIGGPGNKYE